MLVRSCESNLHPFAPHVHRVSRHLVAAAQQLDTSVGLMKMCRALFINCPFEPLVKGFCFALLGRDCGSPSYTCPWAHVLLAA